MRKAITPLIAFALGIIASTVLNGYPADAARDATSDFPLTSATSAPTWILEGQIDALQAELAMAKSAAQVSRSAVDRMRRERADADRAIMAAVPGDLKAAMYQASEENRLSLALLVAVCIQESDCKAGEVGAHGEQGPLQTLVSTAEDVAKRNGLSMADLAGADGIRIGARYLRECIDAEGGDVFKGLASYNRGPRWQEFPEARDYAGAVLGRTVGR